jgi:hypothetical protein
MARQDRFSGSIAKFGRSILILRDAGNISEQCVLVPNNSASNAFLREYQKNAYFKFDSAIVDGDIFQDLLTSERYLVVICNFAGEGQVKDAQGASVYKCNDRVTLYSLIEGVENSFGKRSYDWVVKLVDYALAYSSRYASGDITTPIGELTLDKIVVNFSMRGLAGYVPKPGDRILLLDGTRLQIDGLDPYLYRSSYQIVCSLDERLSSVSTVSYLLLEDGAQIRLE